MGKIIAVANQKGGVGKTTTTVNLGSCIATLGMKVLLIDIDPQSNCTSGMGLNPRQLPYSSYDVLINGRDISNSIHKTMIDTLDILPGSVDLAGAEIELVSQMSRETRLKNAIAKIKGEYDYIFIDCPPSLGLITLNALTAADTILVPIQCEYYAMEGLSQLLNSIKLARETLNPNLQIEGVVLTMYDSRTNLSSQVSEEISRHFSEKLFRTVIPRNVRLSESPSFGLPITLYDPGCSGAKAYHSLANEFLSNNKS
ncbi:MAG: ParA family protein [Clostridiales bacterium]|nr:ParA family protein [Clostridiales bacterium]